MPFKVVYCSSAQPGFEAASLELSTPTQLGWKSHKYPLYPIEIILRFEDPIVSLSELQFLVETSLKPYKIDIYSFTAQPPPFDLALAAAAGAIEHPRSYQEFLHLIRWNPEVNLKQAQFRYVGEIRFGARDNNMQDDAVGGSKIAGQMNNLYRNFL